MSIQTSVGSEASTTGGHGGDSTSPLRVASGLNQKGKEGKERKERRVSEDGTKSTCVRVEMETSEHVDEKEEEELLRSPCGALGTGGGYITRPRSSREGRKALSQYKAAVRVFDMLGKVEERSKEQQDRFQWATKTMESGRLHFEKRERFAASNAKFHNSVEQFVLESAPKRKERSADDSRGTPEQPAKRPKPKAATPVETTTSAQPKSLASEVARDHLTVALLDRKDEFGRMSLEQWKTVEVKMMQALMCCAVDPAILVLPSYDGAGWLFGVKLIKCTDQNSLDWFTKTVKEVTGLWEGANLEIVVRSDIPTAPKAKVFIPMEAEITPPAMALTLLQKQNPSVPTSDWKLLRALKPDNRGKGQILILQINKDAEAMLYPVFGKMAFGFGNVHLRLKKRNPRDENVHTLEAGEVERDLGLTDLTKAANHMSLEEEAHGTHDAASTSSQPTPQ